MFSHISSVLITDDDALLLNLARCMLCFERRDPAAAAGCVLMKFSVAVIYDRHTHTHCIIAGSPDVIYRSAVV